MCQISGHEVHGLALFSAICVSICTVTFPPSLQSLFVPFILSYRRVRYLNTFKSTGRYILRLDPVMASKRSGGSGGDGSSSFDDSPWGEKIQLRVGSQFRDSHFNDPNIRAITIIYGICFVATCCIAIWAVVVRKNSRPLRWGVLAFSIVTSIM